ncbi:MAG: hypothetical protein KJ904_05180 [Alphaproteobacteria bacterium]|nr:hypothetical protein [Alphaproteobacteria bacterium]MBU0796651.1 hypothetical protein [Alphaproteobacteria bacterium]MBU0886538.1 hypothetical protein [Alphaproteobacteria bacterium]MBU1814126.1 hypothetical protein [Alphaproteobacteria bacterium]MBU2089893.1 hypothetical protein [Alphaproteobacteria bacterium]
MDSTAPFLELLSHTPEEFDLTSFARLADAGSGAPTGDRPVHFAFDCDGITYRGLLLETDEGPQLRLEALIGILPYSKESPARRTAILQALRDIKKLAPSRLTVDPRQRIRLDAALPVEGAPTPARLMAATGLFIAQLRQSLQILAGLALPEKTPS